MRAAEPLPQLIVFPWGAGGAPGGDTREVLHPAPPGTCVPPGIQLDQRARPTPDTIRQFGWKLLFVCLSTREKIGRMGVGR